MFFLFCFSQDQITPFSSLPSVPISSPDLAPGYQEQHKTVARSGHAHLSLPTKRGQGQRPGTQPRHPLGHPTLSFSSRDEERLSSIHTPRVSSVWDLSVTAPTATSRFPSREPRGSPAINVKPVFQQYKAPMYPRQTHHGRCLPRPVRETPEQVKNS